MDIRREIPVVKVAIRGANGRMGLQAIYASMENNEAILEKAKRHELSEDDVWLDIVFGAFTTDIPTVQKLLAGIMRSEKDKIFEGYDHDGHPIYRLKQDGKPELRTKYVEQDLSEEPQRDHVIPFDRQEVVDTPEGIPAIKILSKDKKEVLSTIRHVNVRYGELSGEAIMDKVLDVASSLGATVLLSCVGDTAKKAPSMVKWLDKIHEKGYTFGFLESAPAKGWGKRMLSRQDVISILVSRNFSPTGTLFRTGFSLKRPLFEFNTFEFRRASEKFKTIMNRIISEIISLDMFKPYAKFLDKKPVTIKEIEGERILVNFPPDFLNVISPKYLKFSFYEDNEYGYVCSAMIPNLKALGVVFQNTDLVKELRKKDVDYEVITNIPGIFGTKWMKMSPGDIISRGGAVSTSSCTTNGNIVGDFIMFTALHCYYDFFYSRIRGYYVSVDEKTDKHYEEIIEKGFEKFGKYLEDLTSTRSHMIRTVFNFYYDEVEFIDTDMQHGLTRSEAPDVIPFLRETTSGSQTEVPKILSLPDREVEYYTGLKNTITEEYRTIGQSQRKELLARSLEQIDQTLRQLDRSIHILRVLDMVENSKDKAKGTAAIK